VNSSKGSAGPKDFLRRSNDGKGLEYEIVGFCEYVQKYYAVKVRYDLSLADNDGVTFKSCGIAINYGAGESAKAVKWLRDDNQAKIFFDI
jgi:hypothetical protein